MTTPTRILLGKRAYGLPRLENAFTISVSFLNSDIDAYVYDSDTYESLTKRVSALIFNREVFEFSYL